LACLSELISELENDPRQPTRNGTSRCETCCPLYRTKCQGASAPHQPQQEVSYSENVFHVLAADTTTTG
jgi:hypothetical protein